MGVGRLRRGGWTPSAWWLDAFGVVVGRLRRGGWTPSAWGLDAFGVGLDAFGVGVGRLRRGGLDAFGVGVGRLRRGGWTPSAWGLDAFGVGVGRLRRGGWTPSAWWLDAFGVVVGRLRRGGWTPSAWGLDGARHPRCQVYEPVEHRVVGLRVRPHLPRRRRGRRGGAEMVPGTAVPGLGARRTRGHGCAGQTPPPTSRCVGAEVDSAEAREHLAAGARSTSRRTRGPGSAGQTPTSQLGFGDERVGELRDMLADQARGGERLNDLADEFRLGGDASQLSRALDSDRAWTGARALPRWPTNFSDRDLGSSRCSSWDAKPARSSCITELPLHVVDEGPDLRQHKGTLGVDDGNRSAQADPIGKDHDQVLGAADRGRDEAEPKSGANRVEGERHVVAHDSPADLDASSVV